MLALLTPFTSHSFSRTRSCGSKIQAFIDHVMISSYKRTHSSSLYWWCFHYQSSSALRKINEHTIAEAEGSTEHTRNPSAESWESWAEKKSVYTVRCAMGKVTNAKASHVRNYNDLKCEYACMIFKISCSTTILGIVNNAVFRRTTLLKRIKKSVNFTFSTRWINSCCCCRCHCCSHSTMKMMSLFEFTWEFFLISSVKEMTRTTMNWEDLSPLFYFDFPVL